MRRTEQQSEQHWVQYSGQKGSCLRASLLRWSLLIALLGLWVGVMVTAAPAEAGVAAGIRAPAPMNLPQSPIFVAYPNDGYRVAHPYVLLEGSVPAGASLRLDRQPVAVGTDGLFIAWVPLRPGLNLLQLTAERGAEYWATTLRVTRVPMPARPTAPLVPGSPRPAEVSMPDMGRGLNTVQAAWEDNAGQPVLYAREGQRVLVVGQRGDLSRVQLADGQLLWASRNTLRLLPVGAAPVKTVAVSLPRRVAEADGWQAWIFPMAGRVPFTVSETGAGLRLGLIGASASADLLEAANAANTADARLAGKVGVQSDGITLWLDFPLPRPLHGYQAFYQAGEWGDELVVRLREAPLSGPLAGRRIVLDAGHGGSELGGAGALRVPEKDLVLPITLRAAELLRAQGAEVVLTRQDDRTVPLYNRTLQAERVNADVLISLHANAIPDGKDPRTVRGIGSYFTHEQARPLAAALQTALVAAAPAVGNDGLHAGANLALARPTSQPSVLLELGYLTDPQNLRFLMSTAGQEAYAQAVAAGLAQYFAELPE